MDTVHEDLIPVIFTPKRNTLLLLRGLLSPFGFDTLAGWIFKRRNSADRIYGQSAWRTGSWIKAQLQESLIATTLTKQEIISARAILPKDIAVTVVSSGTRAAADATWEDMQRDLTKLTDNCVSWDIVNGVGHRIWDDTEGRRLLQLRVGELVHL